ncbi:MAG: RsmB/NOP family class I SAM-dependent RNA methyltransferase [Paracoccaceae bacterium]|nr:RsmB/NOP family class I SAM-dependent RNA methyltransferase [Paracoccaceae bacterium]
MTPGARVAAAIEILDVIGSGAAAEQALTRWARASRYAGSKDRAAVRDHVYDVLRTKRSAAHLGGGEAGRALMIGLLRLQGQTPDSFFTGEGHAPAPLSETECRVPGKSEAQGDDWNLPDWIIPEFERSLGDQAYATAQALAQRAPVTLRVNLTKTTRSEAIAALQAEGVETEVNPLAETALTATTGARRLRNSAAYQEGLVELQDGASQAMIADLPDGVRCLDFCAGGGGKALAMAAQGRDVSAHDSDPSRMRDLSARAKRAGTQISEIATSQLASVSAFDLVLCDAPCSGSGSWRRAPHAKWRLDPQRLQELTQIQDSILQDAAELVHPSGTLVYATCSVLKSENEDRIAAFVRRNPQWNCNFERRLGVTDTGDGFFSAHLTRVLS